jgi:hypothetical protein
MILIDGILVDVKALLRLKHYCDPMLCRNGRYCCAQYEITVDKADIKRAVGLMPDAAKFAPEVGEGGEFENPFERVEPGRWAIDCHEESGACAFSFKDKKGRGWCSLHAAALKHDLDPYQQKPSVCTMWPLALAEGEPPILTLQDDIYEFPCAWKRGGRPKKLYPDIADNVRATFGEAFLAKLNDAIADRVATSVTKAT